MCPSRRLARINIKWLTPFSPQSIRSVLSYAAGVRLSGKRFSWPTISRSLIGVLLRRRALVANQSHLPQGRLIERVGNGRKSATSPRRFKTFRGKFQVWSVHMCKTVLQSEGAGGPFVHIWGVLSDGAIVERLAIALLELNRAFCWAATPAFASRKQFCTSARTDAFYPVTASRRS